MRIIFAALLSLSAATAAAAPSLDVCMATPIPFQEPPVEVTAEWGDMDFADWCEEQATVYCAANPDSVWCACYFSGAFDL